MQCMEPTSRSKLNSRLWRYLAVFLILPNFAQSHASDQKLLTIGVLAFRGEEKAIAMWQPTADYLSTAIPTHKFRISPLTIDAMGDSIDQRLIDFVLTNPALYAEFEIKYGISRIATLQNQRRGGSYTKFGALVFTRADRTDITTITDLKNKSLMAVHPRAFGGWWMAWRKMKEHGLDPYKDLARLEFSGFPQDLVVHAVIDGKVDVGTVRTDILERMSDEGSIDLSTLRIVAPQMATDFPFMHSTRLYPEWPFSTTKAISDQLAQKVAITLLRMQSDSPAAKAANSAGWTIPLDYQPVHELMKTLKVGPYLTDNPSKETGFFAWATYWTTILILVFLIMLTITFYVNRINRKLSHSTSALESEMVKRKNAQLAEHQQAEILKALYEVCSLPNLSTVEVIDEMLTFGCKTLNLEIGKVCRVDISNGIIDLLNVIAPAEIELKRGDELPLKNTFCSITFAQDFPLSVEHVGNSELKNHPCYLTTGLESYIGTPIWVNNIKYGTINFSSHKPHKPFTEADKNLVSLMGRWAAVSVEKYKSNVELQNAKDLAESANKAKSSFLANMSHELRTPLNAIIGYADILQEDALQSNQEQLIPDMEKIQLAGKHLLAIINDVLDLSKIEAGRMDINVNTIDVKVLLKEVLSITKPLARKNNNIIELTISPDIVSIETDVSMITHCLINLLSNACKFTKNGIIKIDISRNTSNSASNSEFPLYWIWIKISDTGIGIEKNTIHKLFNEFVQADSTTTREFGGTGLGLAISYQMTKLLGGNITVNSVIGKGSTFTLKLPIKILKTDISVAS